MPDREQSFAPAGPAGLMVMVFYLSVLAPLLIGYAPPETAIVLIPIGLAGVLVQLPSGVIELKRGDALNGNITLAFSAFMVYGAVSNLLKFLNIGPQNTAAVDGFVFLGMGIILVCLTGPSLRTCLSVSLFMIATDIFFLLMAFANIFSIPILSVIAGWCTIVSITTLIWTIAGVTLNTTYGREAVSLGKPLINPHQSKEVPTALR